jgi:hypothetical protein
MFDPISYIFSKRAGRLFVALYHKDPCTDGTDDSCGRYMRARHGDAGVLAKIEEDFVFNLKQNYWFFSNGSPKFTASGVLLNMYRTALWIYFKQNRKKVNLFLSKHLVDILHFAENPTDCIGDTIENKYGAAGSDLKRSHARFASIIYADILRKTRKWYQHPYWHLNHLRIEIKLLPKHKSDFVSVK